MKHNETILPPAFLRPEQAAAYLSISRRHLAELTSRGLLPVSRIGRKCTLYARADLEQAVNSFKRGWKRS